jgi:hypothetical protein
VKRPASAGRFVFCLDVAAACGKNRSSLIAVVMAAKICAYDSGFPPFAKLEFCIERQVAGTTMNGVRSS